MADSPFHRFAEQGQRVAQVACIDKVSQMLLASAEVPHAMKLPHAMKFPPGALVLKVLKG